MDYSTLMGVIVGGLITSLTTWLQFHQQRQGETEKWIRDKRYDAYSNAIFHVWRSRYHTTATLMEI